MKALPLSDFLYLFTPGNKVYLFTSENTYEIKTIKKIKKLNKFAVIAFVGIDDINSASKYKNAVIKAEKQSLPDLKKDEYFYDQIIGLKVCTTDGDIIGIVTDILGTGSNDVYIVKNNSRECLIPAIKDVIHEIDFEKNIMFIKKMEGLFE